MSNEKRNLIGKSREKYRQLTYFEFKQAYKIRHCEIILLNYKFFPQLAGVWFQI